MEKVKKIDNRFNAVMISSFLLGIIAHSFIFLNAIYGLDNVAISYDKTLLFLSGAKWLMSASTYLTAFQNTPWLSGVISFSLMAATVYMFVLIFDIKKHIHIWLVAGICQTSPSIIASNTYGIPYVFYIALFFAVAGVYWIYKDEKISWKHESVSVICIIISAAVYGSYLTVTATVMLLVLVLDILNGGALKKILCKGMYFLIALVIGFSLYYIVLRILLLVSNQQLNKYGNENTISSVQNWAQSGPLKQISLTYVEAYNYYFHMAYTPHVLAGIILCVCITGSFFLCRKGISDKIENTILIIAIFLLLPITMDFVRILSNGSTHSLMFFSYILPYVYAVKIMEMIVTDKPSMSTILKYLNGAYICVFSIMIYFGIILANTAYIRMENYYQETYAICNRIIQRVEDCDGYTGKEDVALIWNPDAEGYLRSTGIKSIPMLAGLWNVDDARINGFNGANIPMFLNNIMGFPSNVTIYQNKEEYIKQMKLSGGEANVLNEMKEYPNSSCTEFIKNDVVVVLLGDD